MQPHTEDPTQMPMTFRLLAISLSFVALVATAPLPAQNPYEADPIAPAIGAAMFGFGGLYGGALIGASGDCYEFCMQMIVGALVGEAVGVAFGAHLFNGMRGSFPLDLAASSLGALGLMAMVRGGTEAALFVLGTQVAAVTAVELASAKRRVVSASLYTPPGGVGVKVAIR